jgi:hypothetical protein
MEREPLPRDSGSGGRWIFPSRAALAEELINHKPSLIDFPAFWLVIIKLFIFIVLCEDVLWVATSRRSSHCRKD